MKEIPLESLRVIEPRKQINLSEYRERLAERLSTDTFGTYFHPEESENPYPGYHTIGLDYSPPWKDQAVQGFVLDKLRQVNFVPPIADPASRFILAFEQLTLTPQGEIRLTAARNHEKMHELQAIRFGDAYQTLRTEKIREQLEHLVWQKNLKKKCLEIMGRIERDLLCLGALHETQAMAAEIKTPNVSHILKTNAYFTIKQVLTGFKQLQGQDAFALMTELLGQTGTFLEQSGVGPIHHAMGATILLLQHPQLWQKLAAKEIAYPETRLVIKEALEAFLINPQAMIRAMNMPAFQLALDQALIASANKYDHTLQGAERFLAQRSS